MVRGQTLPGSRDIQQELTLIFLLIIMTETGINQHLTNIVLLLQKIYTTKKIVPYGTISLF